MKVKNFKRALGECTPVYVVCEYTYDPKKEWWLRNCYTVIGVVDKCAGAQKCCDEYLKQKPEASLDYMAFSDTAYPKIRNEVKLADTFTGWGDFCSKLTEA
jgi:hypothetical protein